jgi:hypothetical protein
MHRFILSLFIMGCAAHHRAPGVAGRSAPGVAPTRADAVFIQNFDTIAQDVSDLADPAVVDQVRRMLPGTSQSARAAVVVPAMQAGVYFGQPQLVQMACDLLGGITDGALRGAYDLREVDTTCKLLTQPAPAGDTCPAAAERMRAAWRALLRDDFVEGRSEAKEGATAMRRCHFVGMVRSPVPPDSDGFVLVVLLQGLAAPEVSYLGKQSSFNLSAALFESWQRAIALYGEPRGA